MLECVTVFVEQPSGAVTRVEVDAGADVAALRRQIEAATGVRGAELVWKRSVAHRSTERKLGRLRFAKPGAAGEDATALVEADGVGITDLATSSHFDCTDLWMGTIDGVSAAEGEADEEDALPPGGNAGSGASG